MRLLKDIWFWVKNLIFTIALAPLMAVMLVGDPWGAVKMLVIVVLAASEAFSFGYMFTERLHKEYEDETETTD